MTKVEADDTVTTTPTQIRIKRLKGLMNPVIFFATRLSLQARWTDSAKRKYVGRSNATRNARLGRNASRIMQVRRNAADHPPRMARSILRGPLLSC